MNTFRYWYSIREPFLRELLLARPDVEKAYVRYTLEDEERKFLEHPHYDHSGFGILFQYLFAIELHTTLPNLLAHFKDDVPESGSWCLETDTAILKDNRTKQVTTELLNAYEKKAQPEIDSLQKDLCSILNSRLWSDFFKTKPVTEELVRHLQIIQKATELQCFDALFLMLKPTGFLYTPSNAMGPDIVGFAGMYQHICLSNNYLSNKQICWMAKKLFFSSIGVCAKRATGKHKANAMKLDPNEFFVEVEKKTGVRTKLAIAEAIGSMALPEHRIELNVTLPSGAAKEERKIDVLKGTHRVRVNIDYSYLKIMVPHLAEGVNSIKNYEPSQDE